MENKKMKEFHDKLFYLGINSLNNGKEVIPFDQYHLCTIPRECEDYTTFRLTLFDENQVIIYRFIAEQKNTIKDKNYDLTYDNQVIITHNKLKTYPNVEQKVRTIKKEA